MELLDLPEEVIESRLLKYLSWNDLLRLRHVCNETLRITNGYLRVNPNRAPEIEINSKTGKTFASFMAMGIPTTKIFLNNPFGYHFYEDSVEYRRKFMDRYGPVIKHLRVTQLSMWPSGKERKFLNSLVNIQSFEASHFGWPREFDSPQKADQQVKWCLKDWRTYKDAFPFSFKNLESIRIGKNPENEAINKLKVTGEVFGNSQKLKRAALPFSWSNSLPTGDFTNGSLMGEFYFLGLYMEPRPNDVYSEQGRLELYDFIHYHDDVGGWDEWKTRATLLATWHGSLDFMRLLKTALKTGLRFGNVSPFWFYARDALTDEGIWYNQKELGIPVVSLRGLHPMMMTMEMPNLEKIVIPHTSRCVGVAEGERKPDWPALKILEVNVDNWIGYVWDFKGAQELRPHIVHQMVSIYGLWGTLFKGVVRVNMVELTLTFEEEGRWMGDGGKGAVPRIEDIVGTCPNLKRVKLGNWLGQNKQLLKLWDGLRGLEEVELDGCREVGNVTFVGEDKERPVFFKLKNLKKLTLKGLDDMPKITDLVFEMVFAKMKLKELVLTSEFPVENVTKAGIEALLRGPFNETIEKFCFKGWTLAGVDAEEFEEIGKRFRSHKML